MQRTKSGVLRPRSLSTVGRTLFPAMIWKRPDVTTRFCAYRMTAAESTRMTDMTVAARMAVKLPALWWISS